MTDEDWFAPKRYGFGAGLPIAWQGWVVSGGYIAALVIAGIALLPRHQWVWVAIVAILTLGLTIVTAQHTRGGWHWRWGSDD
jgi:hypothetical protein